MVRIDDDDMYEILFRLYEAKGSIGAIVDSEDGRGASALLEDHRRICEVIDSLMNKIHDSRLEDCVEKLFGTKKRKKQSAE